MPKLPHPSRRHLIGAAVSGVAPFSSRASARSGSTDFGPFRRVVAGVLEVGYVDAGPAAGPVVILLHGWPYDIHAFAEVTPLLTASGYRVIVPYLRGFGATRFLASGAMRNAQPATLGADVVALMDALRIPTAVIAGFDWGARAANVVAALWPERCRAMVSVSGYLISGQAAGATPLSPDAELAWWYQFYFASERGRLGYAQNRHAFAKLIWRTASPRWRFSDATFNRSASALDNPDHVAIVIHNYRWRLGLADSDPRFESFERRLAAGPVIATPTVTLEGDANGAPHPAPTAYAGKFVGPYAHRLITGGIGHNLPQEAPDAFATAIRDVVRL